MSHPGMKSAHPTWLGQVASVTVTPDQSSGRTELGAGLAALADVLGAEEPFKAGEVVAVVLMSGDALSDAPLKFGMMVSTGNHANDLITAAKKFNLRESHVALRFAAEVLQDEFQGVAHLG